MRIEGNSVVFEFAEVQHLLPKELFGLPRLLGRNSYTEVVDGGDYRIAVETVDSHIRIRVFTDTSGDLSKVVAKCEQILRAAAGSSQFRRFLTAIEVMELLEPRLDQIIRRVIAAELYPLQQKISQLESRLRELK